MKKLLIFLLMFTLMLTVSACSEDKKENPDKKANPDGLVLVKGGSFVDKKSNYYGKNVTISNFYIGKYELTQKEWVDVMGSNPSQFKGDNMPVEMVSWYDSVEYCNKRSIKEGLKPYYNIDKDKKDPNNKNEHDDVKWTVTVNDGANGYRLPTEAEWEYAADGGQSSKSYKYSGSDKIDDVAWFWKNSGDKELTGEWRWERIQSNNGKPKPVGGKKPNELGLYDMSGNIREWCWDWYRGDDCDFDAYRVWKGGGWLGDESCCETAFRIRFDANGKGSDQGLRVCRSE